ncbi:MAG: TIGR01906 family membrane protein [Filifactoraceae bacterium]
MMKRLLCYIINVVIILGIFLSSIYYVTLDKEFYEKEYSINDTANKVGMVSDDLTKVTGVLLEYLKGDIDSLNISVPINGRNMVVFDDREKNHMVDVRELFQKLEKCIIGLGTLAICLICISLYIYKRETIESVARSFIKSAIWFILVGLILVVIFVGNFDWFWTNFHLLLFKNDLWMLDPEVSVMINMFPLEFFYDCCFRILGVFIGNIVLLGFLSYTLSFKNYKI